MRVVVDGQITGNDGIGRYTQCLTHALTTSGTDLQLRVIPPAGVPRYSHAEGDHLLAQARRQNTDVLPARLPDPHPCAVSCRSSRRAGDATWARQDGSACYFDCPI